MAAAPARSPRKTSARARLSPVAPRGVYLFGLMSVLQSAPAKSAASTGGKDRPAPRAGAVQRF